MRTVPLHIAVRLGHPVKIDKAALKDMAPRDAVRALRAMTVTIPEGKPAR